MIIMAKKIFVEMTAEEQARWVCEFAEWLPKGSELIIKKTAWSREDVATMEQGLQLLEAWPWARDFVEKARRFGDYAQRAYRMTIYIDKVMTNLSDGLTVVTADGKKMVAVAPSTPLRRRGRPTKEEAAARLRGETLVIQGEDNAEAKKRKAIAKMLGLEVVVTGEPPREKNNDELRQERKEREAREAKMNPSLFPPRTAETMPATEVTGTGRRPDGNETGTVAGTMAEEGSMGAISATLSERRPQLQDIKWLLTPDLAQDVDKVADLRNIRAAESERAKTMTEMGASDEKVEPHTEAASEANDKLMMIFGAIDRQLAEVNYRLKFDKKYPVKLQERFKNVKIDFDVLIKTTNPYLRKMEEMDPTFLQAMQTKVDEEQPERVAERERSEADKKEYQELMKYIKRNDKPASDERVKGLEKRIARIREMRGDELADALMPILEKAKRDNVILNEEKAAKKAAKKVSAGKPQGTVTGKPQSALTAGNNKKGGKK